MPAEIGAVGHLAALLSHFSRPDDVLAAYLRRPFPGFSFRRGIEQLAKRSFAVRGQRPGLPMREIIARAQRMLHWLDGEDEDGRNPYDVLGLSHSARGEQIAQRYRLLSKHVHPDRHGSAHQDYWRSRQSEINQAYRVLSDRQLRARWQRAFERRKRLLRRLWEVEKPLH